MAKRKKKQQEEKGGEGWIVSFADLMTLLFTVFVVLYAMKPEGMGETDEKVEIMTSMIREAFNDIPDEIPDDLAQEPTENAKKVFAYVRGSQTHKPIIKRYIRSDKTIAVINKEMQEVRQKIELVLFEEKRPDIDPTPDRHRPISVLPDKDGFTVRLLSSYFFAPGEYRVNGQALAKVKKIGEMLRELNRRVAIEGHTDSVPKKGPIGNWELSALRASFVARLFIQDLGFSKDRVKASGYADAKPIATNRTEQGRRLNRRVEIKVEYDE